MGIRYTESVDELFLDGDNFCDIFSPEINTQPIIMGQNSTQDIVITGNYFTKDTVIEFTNGVTVNTVTVVNSRQLILNVTTPNIASFYTMKVMSTVCETIVSNFIQTESGTWVDLSSNADPTHPDVRSNMAVGHDANGMYFTGRDPWSSWVKFNDASWQRTTPNTLQWIFTRPSGAMMIGIGSTGGSESSSSQYNEAEVMLYFNSSTSIWGLYGNDGTPGSSGAHSSNISVVGGSGVYKAVFEQNGNYGSNVLLYELPSANMGDWDDTSNLLDTITVSNTLNPIQPIIMPFIIPSSGGSQRFIAFKIGA